MNSVFVWPFQTVAYSCSGQSRRCQKESAQVCTHTEYPQVQ